MRKLFVLAAFGGIAVVIPGCVMMTAWRAIPPPGGCDRCHTIPISANWTAAYTTVALQDDGGRPSFQKESGVIKSAKPASSLQIRKLEDAKCFDCHKSPNAGHAGRTGRYHH